MLVKLLIASLTSPIARIILAVVLSSSLFYAKGRADCADRFRKLAAKAEVQHEKAVAAAERRAYERALALSLREAQTKDKADVAKKQAANEFEAGDECISDSVTERLRSIRQNP